MTDSFRPAFTGALLLVVLADFLFFGRAVGVSLLIFCAAIAAATLILHPAAVHGRASVLRLGLLAAALLPLAENISPLSSAIAVVALSAFGLSVAGLLRPGVLRFAGQVAAFFVTAPFGFLFDLLMWRHEGVRPSAARLAVWLLPLGLGAVFVALFGIANPVIEDWLSRLDIFAFIEQVDVARVGFWLFVLVAVWAFLRPRLARLPGAAHAVPGAAHAVPEAAHAVTAPQPPSPGLAATPPAIAPDAARTIGELVFGKAAILRALLVFNLLFAVQTLLDLAYLWGGVALPDGMNYAAYAHRGAYPLIVTALLAAAFVLAALRPGGTMAGDPVIRRLVYLFVAQNVLLVISSILRLDLYVGIYALTYWRVAAFVWMGLVATGLVLILARIALEKSNEWLLGANLLTLSATLYACSFVNFAALIASYNVDHSYEMTGQGVALDHFYLRSLGPAAFPAIDRLLDRRELAGTDAWIMLSATRQSAENRYREAQRDWRARTLRDWRLTAYLDDRPQQPSAPVTHPTMPGY